MIDFALIVKFLWDITPIMWMVSAAIVGVMRSYIWDSGEVGSNKGDYYIGTFFLILFWPLTLPYYTLLAVLSFLHSYQERKEEARKELLKNISVNDIQRLTKDVQNLKEEVAFLRRLIDPSLPRMGQPLYQIDLTK